MLTGAIHDATLGQVTRHVGDMHPDALASAVELLGRDRVVEVLGRGRVDGEGWKRREIAAIGCGIGRADRGIGCSQHLIAMGGRVVPLAQQRGEHVASHLRITQPLGNLAATGRAPARDHERELALLYAAAASAKHLPLARAKEWVGHHEAALARDQTDAATIGAQARAGAFGTAPLLAAAALRGAARRSIITSTSIAPLLALAAPGSTLPAPAGT